MSDPIVALDQEKVVKLVGVPKSTLNYWEKRGVFTASYVHPTRKTPYRRIYSFRDIVSLRALAKIRRELGVSLEEIRKAGEYLSTFYEAPWAELRFGVIGRKLVFRDPVLKEWIGVDRQAVLELNLADLPHEVERELPNALARDPETVGKIVTHRYVNHNRPTIAGTRILVSLVLELIEEGLTTDQIIFEYPSLTYADIDQVEALASRRSVA